jgi:hypothetical protein
MHCSLAQVPLSFLRYPRALTEAFLEAPYKSRTECRIEDRRGWTSGRTMVMNERPEPDLDHVREAMREHDERQRDERERDEDEREAPDDGDSDSDSDED